MRATNNMEIWIVSVSSGSYDDYCAYNVKAFTSQQAAQNWIDRQLESKQKVNKEILSELSDLQMTYTQHLVYAEKSADKYYEEYDMFENKALLEMKEKYPNYDFNADEDFNGYYVDNLPITLEVV